MVKPPQRTSDIEPNPITVSNRLVRFVGDLKVGLLLLTALLIASTVGELLPFDNEFSLRVVFHTWWFRALLVGFGVSLSVNTYLTYFDATYPQFLPILRKGEENFKSLKIRQSCDFTKTKAKSPEALMRTLAGALHGATYRAYYDGDGLYAHRGLIARFGSTVTHLGLILVVVGALAESYFKTEGYVDLIEGESATHYHLKDDPPGEPPSHPFGFTVVCRDFEFTEYPGTRTASKYKSSLTFRGKTGEPIHDYVRVNHSVKYDGWHFHQESYSPLDLSNGWKRYYVRLAREQPEGEPKIYELESFLPPKGREITPLAGHADRFLALEPDDDGHGVIWTVASKEKIYSRGTRSLLGGFRIEMLEFFPDFAFDSNGLPISLSDEPNHPAALIEMTVDNKVIHRSWTFMSATDAKDGHDHSSGSPLDFVLLDYEFAGGEFEGEGGVGTVDARPATRVVSALGDPVRATIGLKNPNSGRPMGPRYSLVEGVPQPFVDLSSSGLAIEGEYSIDTFKEITAFNTHLSVSRNPGIPISWFGAIFASLGPFVAFFITRRRVWAWVDWENKRLWVGGESRYSREALEDELSEVLRRWSGLKEVALSPPADYSTTQSDARLSNYL